jgi:hypothetical protein
LFGIGALAGKASRYCWRLLEEKESRPGQLSTPSEESEVAVTVSRQRRDEMDKK